MTPAVVLDDIAEKLVEFRHDPLGFVLWAYDWGQGDLAGFDGPDAWQREVLTELGLHLQNPETRHKPFRYALASGHGIGKSAMMAWLQHWGLFTCPDTRGVLTANTAGQLNTKTLAERAIWDNRLIPELRAQWATPAMSIYSRDPNREKTWRLDAIPWTKERSEAFAGLHNRGRRIIVLFDEGSAIDDVIWEVTEGALTDAETEIIWIVFGNPTRNTGRFKECWGRFRDLWRTKQVDSRTVRVTNKEQIEEWRKAYGEDSDFFRVRVKGQFPRAGTLQFIDEERVTEARKRDPGYIASDPIVFGVDVARYGDDSSVLAIRRGRDARGLPWKVYRGMDLMTFAGVVAQEAMQWRPDAIFVDVGGMGAGVVDRLRQLLAPSGLNVIEVNFGGEGGDSDFNGSAVRCHDRAAVMWANMREWLRNGSIPDDSELHQDLIGREYGFDTDNAIRLERKEDMKKRGLASPDRADALALTFAFPVPPRKIMGDPYEKLRSSVSGQDWHPFS